ncbi:hypothetical protein [Rathayibacter iranicus]|uniref:Peptidase S1 domain-containing protein n=2 Tax=Rathayibacter iranicus TaxID=59737 RepID=A0AAD1AET6_9MICO|nr:hypothetical protein [Rathayibacter iranicus]AZZ56928.1 hypothetical protein C7V51_14355 [Rathayibacter iranicus]MWV29527.1 hypothetical protein [Rathayibacter iranicus NCPPB 2253 = VKM Ac-1602]PPI42442.1 hypothetical protein C5E09_13210 [Rathayibacter iranicus]PPI57864.1 hypothetical protein C5E08_14110 [Rathayibacter iranicus]PPI68802.1 hypothetical protein C5E01_13165 [Rathayibacter iranicus]
MQSLRPLRRSTALLAGVCGMVALVTLGPAVPAVHAQTLRDQIPIVSGTALELPGARWCSAGVVLESRSWISRASPIARATRYIALAQHCGSLGNAIKVGGTVVGTITWVSPVDDLEILTVPPSTVQRPACIGASQLHHCTIPAATPKALGRIVLGSGGREQPVPVHGAGIPAVGERFCTSGAVSFVNCSYRTMDVPPAARGFVPATARSDNGRTVAPGDSGGPVASINGTIYGIILFQGHDEHAGTMGYLPIDLIAQDLGYGYDLAPA